VHTLDAPHGPAAIDAQAQATEDSTTSKDNDKPASSSFSSSPLKHKSHLMESPDRAASPAFSERPAASVASSAGSNYRTPLESPSAPTTPLPRQRDRPHKQRVDKPWLPTGADDTDGEIEVSPPRRPPGVGSREAHGPPIGRSRSTADAQLNDVDAPSTTAAPSTAAGSSLALTLAEGDDYVPPYEPRRRAATFKGTDKETTAHQKYALTFTAALSSGADLPLSRRRVELELLWDLAPAPSLWDYVPCARYVPAWRLRAAGKQSGTEREEGWVRWAAGGVPVVGGAVREWL
jgi:hypothetical protein